MKKYKTHPEVLAEMMENPEFKAAYEAEEHKERLQETLAECRKFAGPTRSQFAEKMGVTPPT